MTLHPDDIEAARRVMEMTDDVSESLQGPRFTFEEYQCQIAETIASVTGPLRDEIRLNRDLQASRTICGHFARYCYTSDGGKTIVCLLCEYESRN